MYSWVIHVHSNLILCDPTDCGLQVLLLMGLPRQAYWSRLPFPPPEDLPSLGTEPASPALQMDSLLPSRQGSLNIL